MNEFISHEKTVADLWQLAADQDYTVDAVPAPVAEPGLEIIGYSEYSKEAREHIPKVLNPENNLHIPIAEDVELSGIGWIDGNLHVQMLCHQPDRNRGDLFALALSSCYCRRIISDPSASLRMTPGGDFIALDDTGLVFFPAPS